eukprot:12892505-Prorocentrum_lima.AAC.1
MPSRCIPHLTSDLSYWSTQRSYALNCSMGWSRSSSPRLRTPHLTFSRDGACAIYWVSQPVRVIDRTL